MQLSLVFCNIMLGHQVTQLCVFSHIWRCYPMDYMDHQAPLSMVLFQARMVEWVAISSSRDLPETGIKLMSPPAPARQVDSLPLIHLGSPELTSVQFSSVAQLYPTLWDPMDCSTPGLLVHHQLMEVTQTHVHWVGDAIQPSDPLLSPSPCTFNLCQHQGLS